MLIEREPQLRAGEDALSAAGGGRGALLWIEGAAGVGKTALLAELEARAPAAGARCLHARGSELARDFPFGVVLQLLEPALGRGREREALFSGASRLAADLFEPGTDAGAGDDLPFLHGLYWLVSGLAERGPLLLAVDDAHWADRSSLRFLLFLSQRLGDLPVVLAAAARPGEAGTPAELLREIAGERSAVRVPLPPLSPDGVTAAVRSVQSGAKPEFCRACAELTGGNPFLLQELLASAQARGIAPDDPGAQQLAELAPGAVREAVLVRLGALSPDAVAVAQAVAVLDDQSRLGRVAALAQRSLDEAAAAVDALGAVAILTGGDDPRFAHPLLRSSVYADIAEAGRGLAHLRAARVLAGDEAPAAAVAAQLMAGPATGDAWAVERLRVAAREAIARGAAESAVRHLRRALEEPPAPDVRVSLLTQLAEAETAGGEPDAVGRLEEAVSLCPDPLERGRMLGRLGWMLHKGGRLEEAATAFARGIEEVPDDDHELLAELRLGYIGAGWQVASRAAEVRGQWTALMERSAEGDAPGDRALAAQLATLHLFQVGSREQIKAYARRALRDGALVAEEGADSLTLWHAVGCLSWCDELDESEAAIEAAVEDATRRGLVLTLAQCFYARSWPRHWRGQVDASISDAQAAVDAWSGGWGYYLPAAIHWLVLGHLERGDLEAAERALELRDAEARWSDTTMFCLWLHACGALAHARDDAEAAYEHYRRAGHLAVDVFSVTSPAVMPWRSGAALAADALGRKDEARALAAEELDLARRFGAARPIGAALRTSGLVERGEAGIELLREAVAVLEGSPSALERARALVDLGALLRASGAQREAREPLSRALDLTRSMPGALALRERARAELVATGARPRREALSGLDSLTPTERRVAELAAEGHSNPRIAQTLFVSRKTVEWHLGRVYPKLGVHSREDLRDALR